MITFSVPFRRATAADAPALADFVHFASEGLALYLWTRMAGPDGDPWALGRERAGRDTGAFTWRNAIIRDDGGRPAAGLIGYELAGRPSRSRPTYPRSSGLCRNWRTSHPAPGT